MRGRYFKPLTIALLVATGLWLDISGLLDLPQILEISRTYASRWWMILLLILAQALLFSFALAGSLFLWIVAPLYAPPLATLILTIGATLGGLGAYCFSHYLSREWILRIEDSASYRLLRRHGHFFTLFALRVFPAFPHALVNYSAGVLKLKLGHFIAAALLGIAIKSYIYARAINAAVTEDSLQALLDPAIYGPLVMLSVLSLGALYLIDKFSGRGV